MSCVTQVHCEFCRRGFRSANDLYKHKTRLHAREAGLRSGYVAECPHCQRKFTDLGSAYRDHMDYHAGVKKYKCGVCNQRSVAHGQHDVYSVSKYTLHFQPFHCYISDNKVVCLL